MATTKSEGRLRETVARVTARFRHRFGWLGTALLMFPVLAWTVLLASDCLENIFHSQSLLLPSLISGELLARPFNTYHATGAKGTPTIGYWLFWFTLFAVASLPWALAVRWLSNREKRGAYAVYAFCSMVLGITLLAMLIIPLIWLIQYVNTMGVTPRRIRGLAYCAIGGLVVLGFIVSAFVRRRTGQRWDWQMAVAVIVATPATLFLLVNTKAWAVLLPSLRTSCFCAFALVCVF